MGFTLVELLAVILSFSLLLSLLMPALAHSRRNSQQAECANNLRQIGVAIGHYVTDHDGRLPGPVYSGVSASFDLSSSNELAWHLAANLDLPTPGTNTAMAEVLVCPSFVRAVSSSSSIAGPRYYTLTRYLGTNASTAVPPFGNPVYPAVNPVLYSSVGEFGPPSQIFAMTDLDKGNADPKARFWNDLPYEPVHGKTRNQLYFDWHVEAKAW